MSRLWIAATVLAALLLASGCAPDRVVTAPEPQPAPPATTPDSPENEAPEASSIAWLDTELTDAVTGEKFRLSDFKGKPVLLHAFAAW